MWFPTGNRLHFCLVFCISAISAVPNRPPSIYIEPDKDIYFKPSETVEIPCVADGFPKVKYRWKKNGIDFNPSGNDDRMVQLPNQGTIVINRPEDKDEGIFQCFAFNDYGISMTSHVNLREAKLAKFPRGPDITKTVELGRSLTLPCIPPQSYPTAEVQWVLRDKSGRHEAINFNSRVTMDLEAKLHFTHTEVGDFQDGRAYVCMATNYFMRHNEFDVGYYIKPYGNTPIKTIPEYQWATPSDHFALVGENFKMKCIFSGNPTPEVYWEKWGSNIRPGIAMSQGGQELMIDSVRMEDAGKYECYGTNSQGIKANRNIVLRVESKPSWVESPKSIETSEGAKATFLCVAKGLPSPACKWFVNGIGIDDTEEQKDDTVNSNRFLKPNENNVTIVDLTLNDVFVISCNCSNIHGYVFADVYLNVLKEAPQYIKRPGNEKVAEGQNINMTCQTSGKPDPIITWYKEGQQITGGRYQILPNGDLNIKNIVLSDAGNFKCTAENEYGFIEAGGSLIVRRGTRIESKPGDLEVSAGTDAKFTCTGTTDFAEVLNLGLYWEKDGKRITTSDQRMTQNFQDNSLTISGTISRDSGFYTCVVSDGLSVARASAILTVKDKPDPPVNVKLVKCLQESAEISWSKGASNNAPVQYFVVEYNTTFETDKWTFAQKVVNTVTTAKIDLLAFVTYAFRILSVNKIGQSEPSSPTKLQCSTQPTRPQKNPENVRTIGDKRNYLVVEWTPMPPIEHAGEKFEYIMSVVKDGITIANPNVANWSITRKEILTSDIYQPYEITVKAKNAIGESKAPLVTYTGYSAEDIPQVTVQNFMVDNARITAESAVFNWDFDMAFVNMTVSTPIRGRFQGFKIQFWRRGSKTETFREVEILRNQLKILGSSRRKRAVTTLTQTLYNLQPNTYLEAQIVVMNTYYVSPPSDLVSFTTLPGVPGPVRTFSASSLGSNFVRLSWLPPDDTDRNGIIVGYDIGYQTIGGLDIGKMQERDPQIYDPYVNDTILNGLVASQKYRVHIWARTIQGRGEDYFIELKTTATSKKQNVPSFSIKNINETFFNVTWNRVISSKFGTVVYVEFRKDGASDWMQSTDEVANSWKGIPNLESGTSYEVRLAVTNGVTQSWSDSQKVSTTGVAAAYSLVANFGWFVGLLLSILIIIAIGFLVYLCRKRAEQRAEEEQFRSQKRPVYSKEREPRGETNDYYKQSFDDVHRSRESVENKMYGQKDAYDDDSKKKYDDYDRRYDDDGYNKRYDDYDRDDDRYDDDYGRDDRRYSDYDRDDRRYDDDYDRKYDDDYDRDDRRYDDDYDRDDRRYDDYDRDDKRYSDYDRDDKRYNDYDRDDRRDNDYDHDYGRGASNDNAYEPYERRTDRIPSQDKKRISDMGENEYGREPSKFDSDGYPIDEKSRTPPGGNSTFV